jgi:hypothetical protein
MLRISIKRVNGTVVFDPGAATESISQDGGSFIFLNFDSEAHDPEPAGATFGTWFDAPIAAGTPTTATPSILNTVNKPGAIPYACKLHPTETGTITFT